MSYRFFRALLKFLYRILFRVEAVNTHHIPQEGAVILASNHISLLDPPLVGILIKRKVHFMAKEELFKIPVLGMLIRSFGAYPVKRGSGIDAVKASIRLLKEDNVMGIFPEGTRRKAGVSEEAKKGTAMIALRSKAQIVPVAIVGQYKLFKKTKVVYGSPLDVLSIAEQAEGDKYDAVTEAIMEQIELLKKQYV